MCKGKQIKGEVRGKNGKTKKKTRLSGEEEKDLDGFSMVESDEQPSRFTHDIPQLVNVTQHVTGVLFLLLGGSPIRNEPSHPASFIKIIQWFANVKKYEMIVHVVGAESKMERDLAPPGGVTAPKNVINQYIQTN